MKSRSPAPGMWWPDWYRRDRGRPGHLALGPGACTSMTAEHAMAAGRLPPHHADPFDRMLIAQARVEGLTLISVDRRFADYDVALLAAG